MIDTDYLGILRTICAKLAGFEVDWVVTGSLAFALQGMDTEVHDVDIQTGVAGAYEIERRFSPYVVRRVRFTSAERIRSHFGILMVDGIRGEIMGDIQKRLKDGSWDERADLHHHKRMVEVEGMQIPILTLEYEYQSYLKLDRAEKAEKIREHLNKLRR